MGKLIGTVTIKKGGAVILEQPMRSFVQNFMYLLNGLINKSLPNNGVGTPLKDTANVSRTAAAYIQSTSWYNWFGTSAQDAPAGIDTYGTVVGSGNTAVALTDYKLDTQITNGVGAGTQLLYSLQQYEVGKVSSGSSRAYRLVRYFVNSSGAPVTVKEVGFIARPYNSGVGAYLVLICRDVLGAPVTVNDGELITVELAFQITA